MDLDLDLDALETSFDVAGWAIVGDINPVTEGVIR
jgi:hypothetical protein